ncbi:hypothetical protein FIV42_16250 [Persicimonas caeni]|uniref:Uncharacterized protein n=1 Tax=Persicimonas caeni TaxID=2292766 RepID=A0A4Y6PVG3_PERCE|nr:hypothetical protein [Persicimonas caeni]QDG52233.1 hypothetical protein FIV42_16250 [Persicimonas caeni]QED33455.1 hypothetical protein FRD00_16245 [Persicimonas caeni]
MQRFALWLERRFALDATLVSTLDALPDALPDGPGGLVLIDHTLLDDQSALAERVLTACAEVPVLVFDDHCDPMHDKFWRRRNTNGCVSAETMEARLLEFMEDDTV